MWQRKRGHPGGFELSRSSGKLQEQTLLMDELCRSDGSSGEKYELILNHP